VNGVESQSVPAADRGLTYGDGVFRTLLVRDGIPRQWDRQYRKLANDCAALSLKCPSQAVLAAELERLGEGAPNGVAKIIVTRGIGERGYRYDPLGDPTRILIASSSPPDREKHAAEGVQVHRCRLKLAHQPALAGIKHLNRLENVLARAEWQDTGIAEGVLCDVNGWVIGGTMTNIFAVHDDCLSTPDLTNCGVAGVTRDRVLEAARRNRLACRVRYVSWEDLIAADEVFLVNSVAGVWPVRQLEARTWRPGAIARSMQAWLEAD
jgi:4-amino-4-deoxychorismate lyase